jgi:hypothetical protein
VFGQLTENEGQLRPLSAPSRLRRANSQLRPSGTNASLSIPGHVSAGHQDPVLHSSSSSSLSILSALSPEPESIGDEPLWLPRHYFPAEEEYDSDNSGQSSEPQTLQPLRDRMVHHSAWPQLPTLPTLYKNVFKCAIAYFIASLFTFVPYLSGLLANVTSRGKWEGPSPSGHMVATVYVRFSST